MKKLLSIFAIGAGLLAFTLPTITACKSTTIAKFNLNEINVFKIKVTKSTTVGTNLGKLQINVNNAYNKIKTVIIEEYNAQKYKDVKTLSPSDFKYGSTTDDTHPWAIQIMDGNGIAMTKPDSTTQMTNIFSTAASTTGIILENNALKVKVVTTNKNVEKTTAPAFAHAYLDKFVYSKANINQGHNININNADDFSSNKIIDITSDFEGFTFNTRTNASEIRLDISSLHGQPKEKASNTILTALKHQIAKETKTLTDLNELETTGEIDFRATATPKIYKVTGSNVPILISGTEHGEANDVIYIRLDNLGLNNFIGALDSYLYLKIATVVAA